MNEKKKKTDRKKVFKISFIVFMILLCLALTVFVLVPFIMHLTTDEGRAFIQQKVESFGVFAPIGFVLVEITHIVLAFIPGGPVEIIAGVLFGPLWGVVLCDIGIIIATFIIYNIVQKFGKPLVDTFVSEDKFKKFKFLHDEKKLELLIFILLMVPGTPKDVITYMTALTKIKVTKFCAIAGIARIPTITSSAFMGSSLGEGRYMITIIVFLVTAVVGVGGFFLSNYISNKKTNNADSKGEK